METTVQKFEHVSDEDGPIKAVPQPAAMGTVTITDLEDIFLIPAPSADPRGASSLCSKRCGRNTDSCPKIR